MEASCSQVSNPAEGVKRTDSVIPHENATKKKGPRNAGAGGGLEADLHRRMSCCYKNPGHLRFISIDQFTMEHLPPGCRNNDLVELVRSMSDLSVHVTVTHVTERRPTTVPGSGNPYPCYSNRDCNMTRVGSGWIWRVEKYVYGEKNSYKTCPCKDCQNSPRPQTTFAYIYIITSAHVVFDDLEREHTTCHLFFDRGDTPDVCNGVVTLRGMPLGWSDVTIDRYAMIHVTHDLDLADRVNAMVERFEHFSAEVDKKYTPPIPTTKQKLTIIISHPHGCSKQVSVGYCKESQTSDDGFTQYRYTTATCPGSSGALVFVPGRGLCKIRRIGLFHSGQCENSGNLNYSGYGL